MPPCPMSLTHPAGAVPATELLSGWDLDAHHGVTLVCADCHDAVNGDDR